jgi:hypothetical protein
MTNPLEIRLSQRDTRQANRAYRLIRAARSLSELGGKWATKLVFSRRHGHMRFVPPELAVKIDAAGSWALSRGGRLIAETLPLLDLVGPLTRPVSIVASGPSALDHPWDRLRDGRRFVIAVNGATTLLEKLGIRPDLMVVIDDKFCLSGGRHFAAAEGVPLVIEAIAGLTWARLSAADFTSRRVTLLERVNSWYALPKLSFPELSRLNESSGRPWTLPEKMDVKSRIGWSTRPELGFFSGRTVTYAALQVAVRLGAREIEIIGMDLGGKSRAYAEPQNARPSYLENHYEPFILPAFETMHRALAGSGIQIANRSPVCPLPPHLFVSDN